MKNTFMLALEKIRWDIVGLAEVRKMGEGLLKRTNNYFYYKGETKGYRGVGFYIKKEVFSKITKVKAISERITVLKLRVDNSTNLMIIQVYAPTLASEEKEHHEFYQSLQETYTKEK